ncbi:MAG: hypothetical protein K2J26_06060 [Ruminococcus sp.]|nr:hypothetical protein [Ruminococcus sp.]
MGTQFWWFYDAVTGAVLLVCIFLGAKKGALKSVFSAAACCIAVFAAYAVSGAVSESMHNGMLLKGSVSKIERTISSDTFLSKLSSHLENMGYSLKIDRNKLGNILSEEQQYDEAIVHYINNVNARRLEDDESILLEKLHECYGEVIEEIITDASMSKFVAETAADEIRRDSSGIQELIPMFRFDESVTPAAKFIAEKYTSPAYRIIFRLISFIILFLVLSLLIICSINAFMSNREENALNAFSHIIGGILGILTAASVVFTIAAAVRLWAVMGNNEMIFFNNEAVGKTYVFRYFYDFAQAM